jgi:hypothetical protein
LPGPEEVSLLIKQKYSLLSGSNTPIIQMLEKFHRVPDIFILFYLVTFNKMAQFSSYLNVLMIFCPKFLFINCAIIPVLLAKIPVGGSAAIKMLPPYLSK